MANGGTNLMEKTAALLVNLGTPDEPTTAAVRRYLAEFLADPRVIDLPRWKWLPILHGIILRVRPKKSAALYQTIWTPEGSPLLVNCQAQQAALQERLAADNIRVAFAMSYGSPSVRSELERLHQWGVRRIIILPLYPQYSSTTVASIWDSVTRVLADWRDIPELTFIRDYSDHPLYIKALLGRIKDHLKHSSNPEQLLLSYHGIPLRYAQTGDDYPENCRKTTEALQKALPDIEITQSFQSKFGNEEWLAPATIDTVRSLARQGVRHLAVAAPAFTSDCLETLHELAIENAEAFHQAGGEVFSYIPAVNAHSHFIDCLEELVRERLDLKKSVQQIVRS